MQSKEYGSLMFSLDPNSNPASPAPPELCMDVVFLSVQIFCIGKCKGYYRRYGKLWMNSFCLGCRMVTFPTHSVLCLPVGTSIAVVLRLSLGAFCDPWQLISGAPAQLLNEHNFCSWQVLSAPGPQLGGSKFYCRYQEF